MKILKEYKMNLLEGGKSDLRWKHPGGYDEEISVLGSTPNEALEAMDELCQVNVERIKGESEADRMPKREIENEILIMQEEIDGSISRLRERLGLDK